MSSDEQRIKLRQLIRRQHGVVSLEQAVTAGYTRQAVARKVATKAWFPAGPRVYQVAEHAETPRSRTIAVMLSLGPDAKKALTVLDTVFRLGLDEGARVADRALQNGSISIESLRDAHTRSAGRRGAVIGAELVALAAGGARSWAERALHAEIRTAGVTGWSANTEIVLLGYGRALGDVVFDEEKVIVEVDGWAYHRDLRAFLRDGPRQSALAAAGWVVLRTHWYEMREEPEVFLTRLRATLRARS
jgi:very-short-patch-repair endonuclease